MNTDDERSYIRFNANYSLFLISLSILSLFNAIGLLLDFETDIKEMMLIFIFGIAAYFLIEFTVKFLRSQSKAGYLITFHGWLAFLGSLPIPGFAGFRLIQFGLIVRKMKRQDFEKAGLILLRQRSRSAFLGTLLLAIIILEVTSLLILSAELDSPTASIKNAGDALWWGYVTISTVGYGDVVPTTTSGRIVGIFTVTVGVALFTVTTSFLTELFRSRSEPTPVTAASRSLSAVEHPLDMIAQIRATIVEQERVHSQMIADLHAQLNELEDLIT